jgi:hypothetical protein
MYQVTEIPYILDETLQVISSILFQNSLHPQNYQRREAVANKQYF